MALGLPSLAACKREKPPEAPNFAEVLPEIPMPPDGRSISRAAGEDALLLTFRTRHPVDSIAGYYRKVLGQRQWRLVSDVKAKDGAYTLYAERETGRPPMWVRVLPDPEYGGSLVEIVGARVAGLASPAVGTPGPSAAVPVPSRPDSGSRAPLKASDSLR